MIGMKPGNSELLDLSRSAAEYQEAAKKLPSEKLSCQQLHKRAVSMIHITAEYWSIKCTLVRPKLHGGEFNGNSCKILLNSVDKLKKIVPKENTEVQQVIKVLKDFKTIKDMCFGKEVKSDYRVAIKEFEASYKLLGISVTPKVHAVLDHIEDFFVRQNDGLGLGHHSDQASEAVHKDFTKLRTGAGYNKEYSNNLFKCVVVYNSTHK